MTAHFNQIGPGPMISKNKNNKINKNKKNKRRKNMYDLLV
jgi:hypothetical protein